MNNYSPYLVLIQNASLLLAVAVIFDLFVRNLNTGNSSFKKILLGLILGVIGIVIMNTPWIYASEFRLDARTILLSISGLFFGIIPTSVAMIVTSVYRYYQGGAYFTGITLIIITGSIGIIWGYLRKKPLVDLKWWELYIFGIVVHLGMQINAFSQPVISAIPLLQNTLIPVMVIFPIGTMLLGILMVNRMRREKDSQDIEKNRSGLKSMVDILQSPAEDSQAFLDFALLEVVKLTNSEIGILLLYSEATNTFILDSSTKNVTDLLGKTPYVMEKKEGSNIAWYQVVTSRAPVIDNNYQKSHANHIAYVESHTQIQKLLFVPVFNQTEIVAVVGVANKINDYDEFDIAQIGLTMDMVWKEIDRKKAIENLRISEENYRHLFNQNIDGIFITNSEGDWVDVNDSGCSMLGYSLDELKQDYKEIFRNDDRTIDIENVTKKISPGRRLIRERKLQTKSGNLIDVEITTHLLSDGRIQKVVRNITERKKADQNVINAQHELQALLKTSDNSRKALLSVIEDQKEIEEALSKSEKSYRSLFENITQGFALHKIILDESGKPVDYQFVAVNPAYEKLTGLSAEKIIGKTVLEALPGVEQSWIDIFGEVAISGNAKHFEDYTAAIGKYYDVTAFCPEPGYFAVVISDITERKKYELDIQNFNLVLENRVKDRTEELENANHELESFSYSISHDLRAPLRSIHGFSQIILEDYSENLDPEVNHYFGLIRKNATMMGNLVDDLLSFSRLGRQSLNLVKVDSASIVKEVIESLQSDIRERKIAMKMVELPEVKADPSLLRQIFVNLISNSIKFSRLKNVPEIEVGYETQIIEDGLIHAYFYVKDNGVGFDMKFYDKLFGVFQRLHRAEDYEGTGVGLAIVDRIVKKHGGNVWAESVIGKGTTFYFTLGDSENGK